MAAEMHGSGSSSRHAPGQAYEEVIFVKAVGFHDERASDIMVKGFRDAAEIIGMPAWEPRLPEEDSNQGLCPEPASHGGCGTSGLEELLGGRVEGFELNEHARVILVTDLTDMRMGRVCMAGVDLRTLRDVRPTRGASGLTLDDLKVSGGDIRPGCVLEFEPSGADIVPQRPHLEDMPFKGDSARVLCRIGPRAVNDFLGRIALPSLREIYGPSLRTKWALPDEVERSLGTLECTRVLVFKAWGGAKNRMRLRANIYTGNGETVWDLPFNDHLIRSYLLRAKDDDELKERLTEVNEELNRGGRPIARVGLSRPFAPFRTCELRCWLQVNAVYPGDPGEAQR